MNTKTSLTMAMKDASGQQDISRSITDINPEATESELTAFAQGLAALTTNTLVNTSKVTKEDLSYDLNLTFTVTEDKQGENFITKVDDTTYNVDKSKIPLTTAEATQNNFIRILTKAGDYNIFNNIKDKLTLSFYPTGIENINPTITIIPQDVGGVMHWDLYIFITPNDQEYLNDLVGFKLVLNIPSGTINGYTYSPADLTFNFV